MPLWRIGGASRWHEALCRQLCPEAAADSEHNCARRDPVTDGEAMLRAVGAERGADVRVRQLPDGMAQLIGDQPAPIAVAYWEAVHEYARMAEADGDTRLCPSLDVSPSRRVDTSTCRL